MHRLTYLLPCLNCLMTRLFVVSSSSISQISIRPLSNPVQPNPRAIRFLEIHSTSLISTFRSNVWKRFDFVASPFARVFHNDNVPPIWKMRNQERGSTKRSWYNLFTTFFPSPNKKILKRRIEQTIHGVSYLTKSSKNVLSQWIPFDSTYRLHKFIHLKEDFAFGIRPSDDGAIETRSSQLGPVHLHMELNEKEPLYPYVLHMTALYI